MSFVHAPRAEQHMPMKACASCSSNLGSIMWNKTTVKLYRRPSWPRRRCAQTLSRSTRDNCTTCTASQFAVNSVSLSVIVRNISYLGFHPSCSRLGSSSKWSKVSKHARKITSVACTCFRVKTVSLYWIEYKIYYYHVEARAYLFARSSPRGFVSFLTISTGMTLSNLATENEGQAADCSQIMVPWCFGDWSWRENNLDDESCVENQFGTGVHSSRLHVNITFHSLFFTTALTF